MPTAIADKQPAPRRKSWLLWGGVAGAAAVAVGLGLLVVVAVVLALRMKAKDSKVLNANGGGAAPSAGQGQNASFVPLFNGKDLKGWVFDASGPHEWQVKEGVLVARATRPIRAHWTRKDIY